MYKKLVYFISVFIVVLTFNNSELYADSYLKSPEASERIKNAFERGGLPLMQAEKFMLALSLSQKQREKVEPIFLSSIKKRAKAMRKLKGVNGRPQQAIEDLKKIQRKEKNKLKKILDSNQFRTYTLIVDRNKDFTKGLGNMRIPMVQGGMGGGYNNHGPPTKQ